MFGFVGCKQLIEIEKTKNKHTDSDKLPKTKRPNEAARVKNRPLSKLKATGSVKRKLRSTSNGF